MKDYKILKRFLRIAAISLSTLTFIGTAAAAAEPTDNNMEEPPIAIDRVQAGDEKYQRLFGNTKVPEETTDPDFANTMKRFIYGEVEQQGNLTDKQRELITLVVLETTQNTTLFKMHVGGALRIGITPVEIKEAVYQSAPYVGFPKALDALHIVNAVLKAQRIKLPLESQTTVTEEDRFEKGLAVQKKIYGDYIDKMRAAAPEDQKHIQDYLSAFCFGDTYTRNGLDLRMRELLTFAIIASLGGCESQLKGHIQGNINVGNDKKTIISAATQCMPYIGFPRTLNALRCINEVLPE
ncbi:carboxymuconolactone decarboxylase family protein [Pectinatus haikarae]|uniref:4-carboxymuconolactone decarboxylase n=1 Tax=Pectinatus haikarae TaxID=349096 RepID=A0ABT9YA85_9FIRM|nr:carboxymuconolactone decarboxylase family protein [Pectinatus haikarae]MDQ0204405.1 4-carboxymuconolactone decarboxylase [Pectinatus haikarae]